MLRAQLGAFVAALSRLSTSGEFNCKPVHPRQVSDLHSTIVVEIQMDRGSDFYLFTYMDYPFCSRLSQHSRLLLLLIASISARLRLAPGYRSG